MKNSLIKILAFVLITACDKGNDIEPDPLVSCSELASALIESDKVKIEAEITQAINDLNLSSQSEGLGHKERLEKLVEQIDKCPNLQVVNACYECIETNPVQTEIIINISDKSNIINRTIDLQVKDSKFIIVNVHD